MSPKSRSTTFLLCCFLGLLGVHRFYLNKVGTGILMLLSGGGLLIWWLVDAVLIASGRMHDREGLALRTAAPDPANPQAGFWVRTAAISVDLLILNVIVFVLGVVAVVVLPLLGLGAVQATGGAPDPGAAGAQMESALAGGTALIPLVAAVLYFALQTASRHQATVGKRCFHIQVRTGDGGRCGPARALWRSVCYLFSALPLYLGFAIAGITRNKRALHDYLAGTRVVYAPEAAQIDAAPAPRRTVPVTAATVAAASAAQRAGAIGDEASQAPSALMVLGAVLLAAAAALALLG